MLLSHFVTSPDCICGMDSPLLGCVERSSPKAACGAPKARGLTANAQSEPSYFVAATYKSHSALFEGACHRGAEVTPQPCIRSIHVWIAP